MINKSDDNTRRILNFPAIRPCESVSFSSLLSSLIDLGCKICSFKSKTFFTNKRNARTSIHLIQTLIVFLEEIPNPNPRSDLSIILSLSELHFVFQKIHFLLEDCTRDDARLWMLSKSEKTATHFRVLIRAIAVALDVLPLAGLEIVDEIKELVELVRKQGLGINFEVEKDDRRAMMGVSRALEQFERGIVPESSDLKRVLDYLGITSWNGCNREIKFMENEIGQECSNSEKRELGFLSSLMGFLIFCRCSVFPNIVENNIAVQQSGVSWSSGAIMFSNPDDFKCPITLEIMVDPVTISTGHTYDRSSIEKWFTCGNHTCPKTGEKLKSLDLVPNLAVKKIIRQHLQDNGIPFPKSNVCNRIRPSSCGAGSPAADQAIKMAARFLVSRLFSGTEEEQSKAAYESRLLTKTSNFNRSCLVESNAIPPLLTLIASNNPDGQENAMAALLNISKHPKTKILLSSNSTLNQIVHVLQSGLKIEARHHAAGVLFYLSSIEENRRKIGRISIPGLMGLLNSGAARGKKNALVTILALLTYHENHWRVLSGGVVLTIVNMLTCSDQRDDVVTDCLAVLAVLAEKIEGAMAIVSSGGVSVIAEIFSSSISRAGKEYCVSLLLALCVNDGVDVVPVLVKNQPLMANLYALLAGGSTRPSKKAGSLIRILHAFNEKSLNGSTMAASALSQEQFVHVW